MKAFRLFVLALTLSAGYPAWSGEYEDASAALQAKDYSTALRLFRPLAEQGHPGAQYALGLIYEEGLGVPQSFALATEWYRRTADQKLATAMTKLGEMYESGKARADNELKDLLQARSENLVLAHMWFNLAAAIYAADSSPHDTITRGAASYAAAKRDAIGKILPPDLLAKAQRLASEWGPAK